MDRGRADPVSAQHMGCDAVLASQLGSIPGRNYPFVDHHRHFVPGVCDNCAIAVRNLHQWSGEGRRDILLDIAIAGTGVWSIRWDSVCLCQLGPSVTEHDRFLQLVE